MCVCVCVCSQMLPGTNSFHGWHFSNIQVWKASIPYRLNFANILKTKHGLPKLYSMELTHCASEPEEWKELMGCAHPQRAVQPQKPCDWAGSEGLGLVWEPKQNEACTTVKEQCTAHGSDTHLHRSQSDKQMHVQNIKAVINIWGWGRREREQGLSQLYTRDYMNLKKKRKNLRKL